MKYSELRKTHSSNDYELSAHIAGKTILLESPDRIGDLYDLLISYTELVLAVHETPPTFSVTILRASGDITITIDEECIA